MMRRTALVMLSAAFLLAACSTTKTKNFPNSGSYVPPGNLQLTSEFGITFDKLAAVAAAAAAIHFVYDPLAPNWEITEAKLKDGRYALALTMKRFHAGGVGEARQVLHRRLREIQDAGAYSGYELVEYYEGIRSETLGARYTAEALVTMTYPLPVWAQ